MSKRAPITSLSATEDVDAKTDFSNHTTKDSGSGGASRRGCGDEANP